MIKFVIGVLVGGVIGVVFMAIFQIHAGERHLEESAMSKKTNLALTEIEKQALGNILNKALCGYLEPDEETALTGIYDRLFPEVSK